MNIVNLTATLKFVPDKASLKRTQDALNKSLTGTANTRNLQKGFNKTLTTLVTKAKVDKGALNKALATSTRGTPILINNLSISPNALRSLRTRAEQAMSRMRPLRINAVIDPANLQASLTRASMQTFLPINRFNINRSALTRALTLASQGAMANVGMRGTGGANRGGGSRGGSGGNSGGSKLRVTGHGVGFGAAGVGVFGGFGLASLNRQVRTLQNLPTMLTSVTGSEQRAEQELNYLNDLGNQVGSRVSDMAPEYTKMLASAMGTGLEPQIQRGFTAFTKYGKVMGLDDESMKGSYKAISQMINKQQIMAEELKNQLAERMPAAVKIMADAASGGDTKKLLEMMKKGELDPNKYLPLFFEQLEVRAAGGWDKYVQTSMYWQGQSGKKFEDLVKNFSANGGNEAFIRFWKTLATTFADLNGIAGTLGRTFNGLSKTVAEVGDILSFVDEQVFERFNESSKGMQSSLELLGGAWLAFGTKLGRRMLPILAAYMALSEIQSIVNNEDSSTKRIMEGEGTAGDYAVAGGAVAGLAWAGSKVKGWWGGATAPSGAAQGAARGAFSRIALPVGAAFGAYNIGKLGYYTEKLFRTNVQTDRVNFNNAQREEEYRMMLKGATPEQLMSLVNEAGRGILPHALNNTMTDSGQTLGEIYSSKYGNMRNIGAPLSNTSTNNNEFNITIQTNSDDPKEFGNVFMRVISESMPFLPVGEGAG